MDHQEVIDELLARAGKPDLEGIDNNFKKHFRANAPYR
jgi:hypothetical protein